MNVTSPTCFVEITEQSGFDVGALYRRRAAPRMRTPMIGILIVAHGRLGESLVDAVTHVLGARPPQFDVFPVAATDDPLALLPKARGVVAGLDTGDGVAILSDIYGATPCNLAAKLAETRSRRSDRRRQPADAGASVHLPHEGHGHVRSRKRCPAAAKACCTSNPLRPMQRRELEIINKLGLHARASAKLTQLAAKFESDVQVMRNDRKVNAKSIMGVMMLAAGKGSKITVEIAGPDEEQAMDAISKLVGDCFGEGQ